VAMIHTPTPVHHRSEVQLDDGLNALNISVYIAQAMPLLIVLLYIALFW